VRVDVHTTCLPIRTGRAVTAAELRRHGGASSSRTWASKLSDRAAGVRHAS